MAVINSIISTVLIIAVGFLIYKHHVLEKILIDNTKSRHIYFATTEDGRLIPMVPLSNPNISDQVLLSWVSSSIVETLNYNSKDYKAKLQKASGNYTKRGWESLTNWFSDFLIIDNLKKGIYKEVKVNALSAPLILEQSDDHGRYQWIVEIPITLTLGKNKTKHTVQVIVVRVPRLESPKGIGIEQITFDAHRE